MWYSKKIITATLITSSIILLLLLQGFWLRSVYKDQVGSLRRETHSIFRNIIFDMNDSLLQRSIKSLPGDTLPGRHFLFRDSLKAFNPNGPDLYQNDSSANVQVFLSNAGGDSINQILKPLVSRLKERRSRRFSIQLKGDSLKVKDVEKNFDKALHTAGIDLPLHVKRIKRDPRFSPRPPRQNDQSIFTPSGGFHIVYPDMRLFIIKKMIPQIAFSFFLTLLTISAFIMMNRSLQAQERLMESKNSFISNITHELKTPIATVSVAIEALQNFNSMDNPKLTKEYLDIAQAELNRLSVLTDKILKTTVFENNTDHATSSIHLDELIEKAVSSLKPLYDKQGASLSYHKIGSNFNIVASEEHLTSVLHNLLDNALKYSAPNAIVNVTLEDKDHSVVISVKDNGIGIPDQYKKKIFEKFFRVPTGDVHNVKGYGLGLSYVDSVIKDHGGTIEVKSETGKGSTFIITLKRKSR